MRSEKEVFTLFDNIAKTDDRIRVMTLEGSRVNPNVKPDQWQDYDITFLVTDVNSYLDSDEWLSVFGDLLFMQKPEGMDLFPASMPTGWFSYLMLFSDGVKIDLTLVPLESKEEYFKQDPLIRILMDKDGICPTLPSPSDEEFWVQKPREAFVNDCANEFVFVSTYVARGLLRQELLFANWHIEEILRKELHRMLGYLAGTRKGFPCNTGKRDKWLMNFLSNQESSLLLTCYHLGDMDAAWNALEAAMDLFESAMKEVCAALGYEYRNDVAKIRQYIELLKTL